MTKKCNSNVIAYLAPEIPALSATFVYEEMLALERRGLSLIPITVRKPAEPAFGCDELAARTLCLYEGSTPVMIVKGLASLPLFDTASTKKALRWLAADVVELGLVNRQSWKLVFQFLAAIKLARLLKLHNCRHLHVHFAHVPAQIAMYASALTGIPFTIMAHANDIFERGLLLRQKAERAVCMLTISEYNRRYLEILGIPKDHLGVVRCSPSFWTKSNVNTTITKNGFRIGTLGRLVEKKGFDILIRAIASLKKSGHAIELLIAGDGPRRRELERLVQTLGIADITRFEGSLPHYQVADWMQQFDAFVLACKTDKNGDMDGIPLVLMEAMAQSVPVISTRLSGIPELVMHEETGLLAEPSDSEDLARQIRRLIETPALRAKLTARAREHLAQEFGQQKNLDRLISYFNLPK